MTIKLNWDDLLIKDIPFELAQRCLQMWEYAIAGQVAPIYLSKFGDWFLRHPDGKTSQLSVIEGTYQVIPNTPDEFTNQLNSQSWQEDHLLSLIIYELHLQDVIPGPGECYALAPHPMIYGKIDIENIMIMQIEPWQIICSQFFHGGDEVAEPAD